MKPLGLFMARLFSNERTFLTPLLAPVEHGFYRLAGIDPAKEQSWLSYALAMLVFNAAGFVFLYALMRLQAVLPLNPQGFDPVAPDLAFNTAISFVTNTNWQSYGGETTMGHLVQMAGLTVQNFLSAATGIALAIALVRAFARSGATTVGNFWVDMTRSTLYVLLPISIVLALVFVVTGMPQTLPGSVDATTLEGAKQTIALGPVASQEAIKQLGTNGGGFFNANAAHPFENPNAISNILSIWSMLVISAALTYTFGRMVGDTRQGWALLAAMLTILIAGVAVAYWAEAQGQSDPDRARPRSGRRQHGGQGGPLRRGDVGALCRGHDRAFVRLRQCHARLVHAARRARADAADPARRSAAGRRRLRPLRHAGLRDRDGVRRRPHGRPHAGISRQEDRGARDEAGDARAADPAAGDPRLHRRRDAMLPSALESLANAGPHGLSEILYAYTSAAGNNGSAFAGLTANTPWYNTTLGHRHDARPLRLHRSGDGDRRLDRRQDQGAGLGRHVPDPHRRCSSACWSA